MAIIAGGGGWYMARYLPKRLARRSQMRPIMATGAGNNTNRRMIHCRRYPTGQAGTVTSLARNSGNRDMPHRHSGLRRWINATVASNASSSNYYGVIH